MFIYTGEQKMMIDKNIVNVYEELFELVKENINVK